VAQSLITLDHVCQTFKIKGQSIRAVEDVFLSIQAGEIVCLVGESGCGKTTLGKLCVGLLSPSSGRILFKGKDIVKLQRAERNAYRLAVQMIHQDPYASLNPTHSVYKMIAAPLQHHKFTRGKAQTSKRVRELLTLVDLIPPNDFMEKFPYQLSGGQRQRVSIARMLTVSPSFLVADEAVSMVDASIRISLLGVLSRLQKRMGLAVLFITHDLALARYFAREGRIGVMYLGRLVEVAPTQQLIEHPQHPYTKALLSAVPEIDTTSQRQRVELRSMDVPSPLNLPKGCAFHPRCPYLEEEQCKSVVPKLVRFCDGSAVACHLVQRRKRQSC
jgi:oligopeptide/dipeptide ABC transporter ATP-binding protein